MTLTNKEIYIYKYITPTNYTHYLLPQTKGVGCRREAISIAVPGNTGTAAYLMRLDF